MQHLGLFVPWHRFLSAESDDINAIWERSRTQLSKRMTWLADNVQLLHRSAQDAHQDMRQWAARSGASDATAAGGETGAVEIDGPIGSADRSDEAGVAARVLDVFRRSLGRREVTHGSAEIGDLVGQLGRLDGSLPSWPALAVEEGADQRMRMPGSASADEMKPRPERIAAVKRQQNRVAREREAMIQGIQTAVRERPSADDAALARVANGFGEEDVMVDGVDGSPPPRGHGPSSRVQLGPSTSFAEAGRRLAADRTLNARQTVAFRLVCRQLDRIRRDEAGASQSCQFLGGEGGTGKSRVVEAIADLFAEKAQSHRLLVTAMSGAAAANINGVTIHSACKLSIDSTSTAAPEQSARPRLDGQTRMHWQEKWLLIIDEVSMLGACTLYQIDQALRQHRACEQPLGGIPLVLFCGDFHQFRPVHDLPIVVPPRAAAEPADMGPRAAEAQHQQRVAHELWRRFTTVVVLTEQVRAAGDPQLRRLLTRLRWGIQDHEDLELLNRTCYQPNRRIPWESGLTVVTPLNRNRWNLNLEAALAFQRQQRRELRIFLATHDWKGGVPGEAEAREMLSRGDDSEIPVPGIFLLVPGMPVVVNRNSLPGLKLVNGAQYTAVDAIVDRKYPGFRIGGQTILHFGPPAGLILTGETTQDLRLVDMPARTILLTPISVQVNRSRKRPWQTLNVSRRGLPCAAAFTCTDYKVQGRTLARAALELRGTGTTEDEGRSVPGSCDPYSLYVQLSRCQSLADMMLLSEVRPRDFIGNHVPADMVEAERRLERQGEATVRAAAQWGWGEP